MISSADVAAGRCTPEAYAEQEDDMRRVRAALWRLAPTEAQAVALYCGGACSTYAECGRLMGCSTYVARSAVANGLRELRRDLLGPPNCRRPVSLVEFRVRQSHYMSGLLPELQRLRAAAYGALRSPRLSA